MNIRFFLLVISLFFSTLQAIYFRNIGLAPLPIIGFFIAFFISIKIKTSVVERNFIFGVLIIVVLSLLIGLLNLEYLFDTHFYFPSLFGWLLFPFSVIAYRKAFKLYDFKKIEQIVSFVLIIHLAFFYTQYLLYTFFNIKLDYLYVLTGEQQRMGAAKLKEFFNLIRATGLFSEPGSYSVYIYILVSIKLLIRKNIDILSIIGIASMFLSYSMTGVLMAFYFLGIYLFFTKYNMKKVIALFISIIILVGILALKSEVFLGPIQERLLNIQEDGSASARFQGNISNFIASGLLFVGIGIGVLSDNIKATSALLSGLFNMGVALLSVFLLLSINYIRKWSNSYFPILLLPPVLMSNISFNQIIYTVFFAFLTIDFTNQRIRESI